VAYRIVANYLNYDPITFVYNADFHPYSIHFDYPNPRLMRDTVKIYEEFAENTMRPVFMEGTKKAVPQTPYPNLEALGIDVDGVVQTVSYCII